MFTTIQVYNTPGTFVWNKPKNSSGADFDENAFIIVEVCSGGGGGSSGYGISTDDPDNQIGAIGGAGGGCSSVVVRSYSFNELADQISIVVGDGGNGGIASSFTGATAVQIATPGQDGNVTSFGPLVPGGFTLKAKPGTGAIVGGQLPFNSSSGGTLEGGSMAYINSDREQNGTLSWFGTYGGAAGAGYIASGDSSVFQAAGTSPGGGNGGGIGTNGSNATEFGCGGGGGGTIIIPSTGSGKAGDGAKGKCGYVKIVTNVTTFW